MRPSDDLKAVWDLFVEPERVVELRVLGHRGNSRNIARGYFDNRESFISTVVEADKPPFPTGGIYWTINPVHPDLIARSNNHLEDRIGSDACAKDDDILRRHWFFVDIDSVRKTGISATEAERKAAFDCAASIAAALATEFRFPQPILADSGNGAHLYWRVRLRHNDGNTDIVKKALKALSARFSNKQALVDTSVYNISRIARLCGTWNRKGDQTHERQYHYAKLLLPEGALPTFQTTPILKREQLLKLSQQAPREHATDTLDKEEAARRMERFLADNSIQVEVARVAADGGYKWHPTHCPFNPEHTGTSVAVGVTGNGRFWFRCLHNSCSGKGWPQFEAHYANKRETKTAKTARKTDAPHDLAREWIETEHQDEHTGKLLLRRYRQTYYRYNYENRRHESVSRDQVKTDLSRFLGSRLEKVTGPRTNDVRDAVDSFITIPEFAKLPTHAQTDRWNELEGIVPERNDAYLIPLRSHLLDVDRYLRGEPDFLRAHDPDWFYLTCLPFDYPLRPEDQQCPHWEEFLEKALRDDDRIALIQEMFGLCISQNNSLGIEAFFLLIGFGANGKSTLLTMLQEIVGEGNYSTLSISQLDDAGMQHNLYGKLANICPDMGPTERIGEDLLKKVSSGEQLVVKRKYKDDLSFVPFATQVFAANKLPAFVGDNDGLWRRLHLIRFPHDFRKEPGGVIPNFFERYLKQEVPAVFVWALQGLARLYERGKLTSPADCEEAKEQFRQDRFPIYSFVKECCDIAPRNQITLSKLYNYYRIWARNMGNTHAKTMTAFERDLRDHNREIDCKAGHTRMTEHRILLGVDMDQDAARALDGYQYQDQPSFTD